jgi:xanthine dehydrogenase YagS FAD-binding subunit
MKSFTYHRPTSAEQAIGLLDSKWGTTELLAGGTDLHDLQKEYVAQPDKVVSLGGITSLTDLDMVQEGKGGSVTLGAGTSLASIAENADLQKLFPALTEAAGQIGGPQIRNMGTLGGNLCQRNRCWYFRDEHVTCLLKGGEKCYALDGENQYHAIFTQGHKCVIVNPSTLAPVLIALGASANVLGAKGKRRISLDKFFQAPSSAAEREHVLAPNEIVLSVIIPIVGLKSASYEVRQKQACDWSLVQAAVALQIQDNEVKKAKVVLGHVAPTPHLAEQAAKALVGKEVTETTAAAAGEAAAQGAKPLRQNGYKVKLIEVAVKRAVLTAAGHKKYWEV